MKPASAQVQSNEYFSLYDQNCFFCHGDPSREIMTTENFRVLHDRSPISEGHLLIYTRHHYACAGELPADLLEELCTVRDVMSARLREAYGASAYYEHGKAGHCMQYGPDETICHHFHLHILPFTSSIRSTLSARFHELRVQEYTDLNDLYDRFGHYLYFEEDGGDKFFYPAEDDLESHYLRTLISNEIGHPERADWENYQSTELLHSAKQVLGPRNDLPPIDWPE